MKRVIHVTRGAAKYLGARRKASVTPSPRMIEKDVLAMYNVVNTFMENISHWRNNNDFSNGVVNQLNEINPKVLPTYQDFREAIAKMAAAQAIFCKELDETAAMMPRTSAHEDWKPNYFRD